jgi:sugar lactone lactonase YvrE
MQASANLEVIGNESCVVGESPLWCESQQSWFWVDIPRNVSGNTTPASSRAVTGTHQKWWPILRSQRKVI